MDSEEFVVNILLLVVPPPTVYARWPHVFSSVFNRYSNWTSTFPDLSYFSLIHEDKEERFRKTAFPEPSNKCRHQNLWTLGLSTFCLDK